MAWPAGFFYWSRDGLRSTADSPKDGARPNCTTRQRDDKTMFMILIGAILVGISAAAISMLPFRLMGRKTPKGLPPIAAGLSLVAFVLWNDYSWFDRTAGELPDRVAVVEKFGYSAAIQPWTLVWPRTNRFSAIDRATIRRNEALPGYAMAEVVFVQRYQPTLRTTQFFDCTGMRRADLVNDTRFSEDGMPENAVWVALDEDDAMLEIVCDTP
jgi:hypothetical protein